MIYDRLPAVSSSYRVIEEFEFPTVHIPFNSSRTGDGSLQAAVSRLSDTPIIRFSSGVASWPIEGVFFISKSEVSLADLIEQNLLNLESSDTWVFGYDLLSSNSVSEELSLRDIPIHSYAKLSVSSRRFGFYPELLYHSDLSKYPLFSFSESDWVSEGDYIQINPIGEENTLDIRQVDFLYNTGNLSFVIDNNAIIFTESGKSRFGGLRVIDGEGFIPDSRDLIKNKPTLSMFSNKEILPNTFLPIIELTMTENAQISRERDLRRISDIPRYDISKWLTSFLDESMKSHDDSVNRYLVKEWQY